MTIADIFKHYLSAPLSIYSMPGRIQPIKSRESRCVSCGTPRVVTLRIHTRLKACLYTEKSSHSWDISQYTIDH